MRHELYKCYDCGQSFGLVVYTDEVVGYDDEPSHCPFCGGAIEKVGEEECQP